MSASGEPKDGRKHGHFLADDFPAPLRGLAAISRGLAFLEGIGIGASLCALVMLALWQLVTRNLRMHGFSRVPAAPDWTDNVLRHSVFLIGFLGAMFATYTARHLRVDAVTRMAGVRGRLLLRLVSTCGAITVCGFIIHAAWAYRRSLLGELGTEGEVFTPERGAMIIVVGVAVILFHFVVQLLIDAAYLLTRRAAPSWWIAEAAHGGEVAAVASADSGETAQTNGLTASSGEGR